MVKSKKIKIKDSASISKQCVECNPIQYLKFCFSFAKDISKPKLNDEKCLYQRLRWLSQEKYYDMIMKVGKDKSKWFETIELNQIKKEIPSDFRKVFPSQTNEKYDVIRVYPFGTPEGSSNPRIIGMIKHSVFYVLYLDWNGKLYKH